MEPVTVENLEFEWGKMKGRGGKKKDVQFYESFTYDGVDYSLYDCVYLYKEGEPEPYIGKLIKIWQNADKTKKVKVHWFFRPSEIFNWLGEGNALENEIFLATGEGVGSSNINSLEAIAGKCNVVCTVKDDRNRQPSEQELEMADYIFYRTFDVEHCTISDQMGDKVAGLEVKFVFNWKENENSEEGPKPSSVNPVETLLGDKTTSSKGGFENDEIKKRKSSLNNVEVERPHKRMDLKSVEASNIEGYDLKPLAKSASFTDKKMKSDGNDLKPLTKSSSFTDKKMKTGTTKDFMGSDKGVKSAKDTGAMEDRPFKIPRTDNSIVKSEQKDSVQKLDPGFDKNGGKDMVKTFASGGNKVACLRPDGDPKPNMEDKVTKLSSGKLSSRDSPHEARRNEAKEFVVTRRPKDERINWFRALPWEERIKSAYEQGTVIELSNLDPGYSSSDVEDIVWHVFKEFCTAKMVQRTASSSPHSGRAFVITKTRAIADTIIKELEDGCLILPNGRPLVGSRPPPLNFPGKQSTFFGHLSVDKIRNQMQREMRDAVSTSHCSQPNNIEFEMALDWCLLQSRFDISWNRLYKQQGEELRKLKANLKLK